MDIVIGVGKALLFAKSVRPTASMSAKAHRFIRTSVVLMEKTEYFSQFPSCSLKKRIVYAKVCWLSKIIYFSFKNHYYHSIKSLRDSD
jgi:hypothetical protein